MFNLNVIECDMGSYGDDCNKTCGYCRDVNKCSHINGICLSGCDAGYQGDTCNTREFLFVCLVACFFVLFFV